MYLLRDTEIHRKWLAKHSGSSGIPTLLILNLLIPNPVFAALTSTPPPGGSAADNAARAAYYNNFYANQPQPCGAGTDCYRLQQEALAKAKKEEEKEKQEQMMIAMAAIAAAAALLPMLMKEMDKKGGKDKKGKGGGDKGDKKEARQNFLKKIRALAETTQFLFSKLIALGIPEARADDPEDAAQRAIEMAAYNKAVAGEIVSEEDIKNLRTPVANLVDQINNQRRIYNAAQARIADLDKKIKILDSQEKMVSKFISNEKSLVALVQPIDAKAPIGAQGTPPTRKGQAGPSSLISSSPTETNKDQSDVSASVNASISTASSSGSSSANLPQVAAAPNSKFHSSATSRLEALQTFNGDDMVPRISSEYSNKKVFDVEQKDAVGSFLYQANGKLAEAQQQKRELINGNEEKITDSLSVEKSAGRIGSLAEINAANSRTGINIFKQIHFAYEGCLQAGKLFKGNQVK